MCASECRRRNPAYEGAAGRAERFAQALDREDFAAAARILAPDCEYSERGRVLRGPEATIASYREASERGAARLDCVHYESSVRPAGERGAIVAFEEAGARKYRFIRAGENHFSMAFTYTLMASTRYRLHSCPVVLL